ncbi:MAG: PssE/Cps14G family polysaccharide biosynthesis glycosyltransferase [Candidatus Aenigmarchaeota archaeon]|nr:PssE/Cps14G family polysaccharide biosynthesis glycosyltransferase [Candidatus Aenigmarchaeota archaeon]
MILVTCGTHEQPFNRLLKKVDELVRFKKIGEKVIAQVGYSTYIPKNIEYFRFADFNEMEKLFGSANLIITHGGIGSVLLAIRKRKKVIVVPRLKKFNEHSDDHQVQVVKELERQDLILAVYDIDNLYDSIVKSKKFSLPKKSFEQNIIVNKIREELNRWEKIKW